MIVLYILAPFLALYLLWLAFRMAVFALPIYGGIAIGMHLHAAGHGYGAAIIGGFGSGFAILMSGQLLLIFLPSNILRAAIIAIFVIPAAVAGYHLANGLAGLLVEEGLILTLLSLIAGLTTGVSALTSLALPLGDEDARSPPPMADTASPNSGD